jgi:hypothetical protein
VARISASVSSAWPEALLEASTVADTLTFSVPRQSLHLGRAFDFLESHREEFGLREYAVSQTNLEDLFVSTVQLHKSQDAGNPPLSSSPVQQPPPDQPDQKGAGRDLSSLDTGLRKHWVWLDRRSHRTLAIWTVLWMVVCYIVIVWVQVGYVGFVFFASWVACAFGCLGCCCMIPRDPDESTETEG